MVKGRVRSFGAFLGLSIITLGIYFLYWLYINLREIQESFTFDENETTIETTQKLFVVYIIITVIVTIASVSLTISNRGEIHPVSIFLSLISGAFAAIYFYYFTNSVILGQTKAQLSPFELSSIYFYYIIGIIIVFIGNFIPFLGLLGVVFILIYIYSMQKQINRIWTGDIDVPEIDVPASSDNRLPKLFKCPSCGKELELEEEEQKEKRFTCPVCHEFIDMNKERV